MKVKGLSVLCKNVNIMRWDMKVSVCVLSKGDIIQVLWHKFSKKKISERDYKVNIRRASAMKNHVENVMKM